MKNLQLSLKKKWFDLTESGIKTEDYRGVTPYWANRLIGGSRAFWKGYLGYTENNKICYGLKLQSSTSIDYIIKKCGGFKPFGNNIMTSGYPKLTDTERILTLKHEGIEVREGNPEWGAIKGVKYFVIKHGAMNNLEKSLSEMKKEYSHLFTELEIIEAHMKGNYDMLSNETKK